MKILLLSIGSRGDMEPFLAIGELLAGYGHEVVCAFPEQFRSLAEDSGFRFLSLGKEFIEMLESPEGRSAMGGSAGVWKKIKAYIKLARIFSPLRRQLMERQFKILEEEQPDRLVHHAKAVYAYIWGLTYPGQNILIFPVPYTMHPVKDYGHIMFNRNFGVIGNKLTYQLARFGLVRTLVNDSKVLPLSKKISGSFAKKALDSNKSVYTISPTLFSRPWYWPEHVVVMGYHERNKKIQWQPGTSLLNFLKQHPKFILVTFGSMTNPDPEGKTRLIVTQLQQLKIPAIINTAGGGLAEIETYDSKLIHFVNRIPYDYLLPKTYAVMHHGGSGTSHMAIKYGCASLIIPHIIDQFFWNKLLANKGAGPKGPSITQLSAKNIGPLLRDLWSDPSYKEQALLLAKQMTGENFKELLTDFIIS